MTKSEIARTIVDICAHDASFCKDLKGEDPDCFLSKIFEEMTEDDFLFSVDKYLASFGVRGHLYFYKKNDARNIGFQVRRYHDSLYVTDAEKMPLLKGDEIVAIDEKTIPQVAKAFFFTEAKERCCEIWEKVILRSHILTVQRAEKIFEYPVRTDLKRRKRPPYSCKKQGDVLYLRLDNFFDENKFQLFLDGCREKIENTPYLIIDVRENAGGSDTVFLPLLKYCHKEDETLPAFTSTEEVLYTQRNAESRIKIYKSYLEKTSSRELCRYFEELIEEQKKNAGKGFMPMREDGFLFTERGTRLPLKIVVLTDDGCASSGESFVEIASKLEKVTVIGRPTMGICDYSNLAYFDFGEYVLHYPTSRSKAIDEGKGTRGRGLQPDIVIPWTPKHIRKDIDLLTAKNYLLQMKSSRKSGA